MDAWLEEFKNRAFELHKQGKLVMFSHGNNHIAYKTVDGENVYVRYICEQCGNRQELVGEMKMPYRAKCSKCKFLVWKTKLQKARGKKKERSEKKLI